MYIERNIHSGPFREFELDLRKAVENSDRPSIKDLVRHSDILSSQNGGRNDVTRVLWKVIVDAPVALADLILASLEVPFDFNFVDDINGRICLHEAAAAGALRLVNLCLERGSQKDKLDAYGRSALHYAAMHGHAVVCRRLLEANVLPHVLDADNCSPLVYAILRGSVECVRVLVCEGCISPESLVNNSLVPLSIASQHGYTDVVGLLLKKGATSLPNTNGEYPIHLAAREGHADVCRLLLDQGVWDLPDKFHEWTPLFHAAHNGHAACIEILLKAGAKVDKTDELGHQAIHYAAWYGHPRCVDILLAAIARVSRTIISFNQTLGLSQSAMDMQAEVEADAIPSLSLPPPIMPHRVYGHNYLDKNFLITVTVGLPLTSDSVGGNRGVKILSRLSNFVLAQNPYLPSPNRLKMVITAVSSTNAVPYTISLPQKNIQDTFVFQTADLGTLSLEFSIYPSFGTRTIGRAVAHPSIFQSPCDRFITIPILDHRLHCMGEVSVILRASQRRQSCDNMQVSFCATVTSPFQGVTLEVGGAVETYWKSLTLPQSGVFNPNPRMTLPWRHSPGSPDSIHTSSSVQSAGGPPVHAVTLSSLSGYYIHAAIQVTRDLHPVLCHDVLLPEASFDLGVADVTLAQFEALARKANTGEQLIREVHSVQDWSKVPQGLMVSLSRFMQVGHFFAYLDTSFLHQPPSFFQHILV